MVENENYVTIQGWMVKELGLKGNELLIYALIYGFSQIEGQNFNGSLQYLSDWTNSTKQGVIKSLNSLIEKGFIKKNERFFNNIKFCEYHSTLFNTIQLSLTGESTKFNGGVKQSLPNNINNNIVNNNNNIKKENNKEKRFYGELNNVLLTQDEYNKLKDKYPNDYQFKIDKLSYYISSKGDKYKSHYATILNWSRKEEELRDQKNNGFNKKYSKFDYTEVDY